MNVFLFLTFLKVIFADENVATSITTTENESAIMVTTTTTYMSTICNGTCSNDTENMFDLSLDDLSQDDRLVLTPIKVLSSKIPERNGNGRRSPKITPKPDVDPNFYKKYFGKNSEFLAKISFMLLCLILLK